MRFYERLIWDVSLFPDIFWCQNTFKSFFISFRSLSLKRMIRQSLLAPSGQYLSPEHCQSISVCFLPFQSGQLCCPLPPFSFIPLLKNFSPYKLENKLLAFPLLTMCLCACVHSVFIPVSQDPSDNMRRQVVKTNNFPFIINFQNFPACHKTSFSTPSAGMQTSAPDFLFLNMWVCSCCFRKRIY